MRWRNKIIPDTMTASPGAIVSTKSFVSSQSIVLGVRPVKGECDANQ